jgi:hypothetical protein
MTSFSSPLLKRASISAVLLTGGCSEKYSDPEKLSSRVRLSGVWSSSKAAYFRFSTSKEMP